MQQSIPECFYRISIKALILDDKKRFLLTKEENGKWELPGGGLEFGEKPQKCLTREIKEEMGLDVTFVADNPSYFLTSQFLTSQKEDSPWSSNVVYLAKVNDLNFTPSNECVEVRFFTKKEALKENLFSNIVSFIALYDPKNHQTKNKLLEKSSFKIINLTKEEI